MDQELIDAAKLHHEATEIIAQALIELRQTELTRRDAETAAAAILARLAHASILLERYDEAKETSGGQ